MAEHYNNTSEDTVLFTAQAKGEQLSRQSNCKRELVPFHFKFNPLAL